MLAKKISETLDNKLSLKDLRRWQTIEREPLCKEINFYKICGFPPPTSGGIGLIQIISILNNKKNCLIIMTLILASIYLLRHQD